MSLVFALALVFGSPTASASTDGELKARFFASDYTICDAHFVAKTFDFTTSEAKAYIGQKIEWGTTSILDGDLDRARERGRSDRTWRCQFYQTDYTSEDAQALAAYWGISSSEAKVRVEEKILWGNEKFLKDVVLPEARSALGSAMMEMQFGGGDEIGPEVDDSAQTMAAFLASKYDECHARMLVGTYFGSTLSESKQLIGYKVSNGWGHFVDQQLDEARRRHQSAGTVPCQFYETKWTPSDAEALAQLWGQTVSEAKARIERKYAFGTESIIAEELRRARGY